MGFLSALGIGAVSGLAAPIDAIGNLFDKLFTSDEERAQANAVMEKLKQHPMELQVEINKLEAQHRSVFVAGWRPAIGWVMAASLFCFYVPQFSVASFLWARTCISGSTLVPFPISDISGMLELILAMLGMATLRSVEKLTNKSK